MTTSLRIIHNKSAFVSMCRSASYRRVRASSASLSNGERFRFRSDLIDCSLDGNPSKRCHFSLTKRNCCRRPAIYPASSIVSRAYTAPATDDECAACSSAA